MGENVKKFEKKISTIINCKHTIGVANGTDALEIALAAEAIKKGTEIITTSNTFISTVNAKLTMVAFQFLLMWMKPTI